MNATDSEILIGTSGYDYPEWKGAFYPADMKRADFLAYYATQFNAVELNSTFYNMPTAERLQSFYERSGGRLKFSVKANRLLTHEISARWNDAAKEFILALDPVFAKGNLCAVLFQFPQSFHYTDENRIYLAKLIAAFKGYPVMIEFRHSEWLRESVFCGLEERGTGLVYCDMPQLKYLPDGKTEGTPFVGPNAYIRLHGRNADACPGIIDKNTAMFLGFFVVKLCKSFCRSSSYANWNTDFLINPPLQIVADFFVIIYAPVAVIKKEEGFINRVFFNIRRILHIYGSNPPADVCIKCVIAGKNRNSAAVADIPDFEIGISALNTASFGFLVECDYNSIII